MTRKQVNNVDDKIASDSPSDSPSDFKHFKTRKEASDFVRSIRFCYPKNRWPDFEDAVIEDEVAGIGCISMLVSIIPSLLVGLAFGDWLGCLACFVFYFAFGSILYFFLSKWTVSNAEEIASEIKKWDISHAEEIASEIPTVGLDETEYPERDSFSRQFPFMLAAMLPGFWVGLAFGYWWGFGAYIVSYFLLRHIVRFFRLRSAKSHR